MGMPRVGLYFDTSGFGEGILRGVADYAHRFGPWRFIKFPHHRVLRKEELREREISGMIGAAADEKRERFLLKCGVPAVNIVGQKLNPRLPTVLPDYAQTGRVAAEHLIGAGLKEFVGFTGFRHDGVNERFRSFRAAVEKAGWRYTAVAAYASAPDDGQDLQRAYYSRVFKGLAKPAGVFALNDDHAAVLIDAIQLAGLRVPQDFAVLGVDNRWDAWQLSDPEISSVDLNGSRIGFEAAKLLARLMKGEAAPGAPIMVPPAELVSRGSSDVLAFDDEEVIEAVQFIRANATKTVAVDDVARHVNLSRRSLETRFRKCLRHSIHDELQAARLSHATRLLGMSDMSITQVALASGFRSVAYFSRVIRISLGVSPREFREKNQRKSGHQLMS